MDSAAEKCINQFIPPNDVDGASTREGSEIEQNDTQSNETSSGQSTPQAVPPAAPRRRSLSVRRRMAPPRMQSSSKYKASPRFTFGGRPTTAVDGRKSDVPGPGTYSQTSEGAVRKTAPQYTLGGRHQENDMPTRTPGPGHYKTNASRSASLVPKGFGTSPQREIYTHSLEVGPGSYKLPDVLGDSAQISFAGRPLAAICTAPDGVPGPGTYESRSSFKKTTMTSTGGFGIAERCVEPKSRMPGPGQYDPGDIAQNSCAKWSMAGPSRNHPCESAPGPGAYACLDQRGSGPSYSLGGRPRSASCAAQGASLAFDTAKTPGPGTYELRSIFRNAAISTSGFGTAERYTECKSGVPGPGQYAPSDAVHKSSAKWSMLGHSQDCPSENTPGPGTYFCPERRVEGLSYSLGGRTTAASKLGGNDTPGPDAYNIRGRPEARTNSVFPIADRDLHTDSSTPGPGSYRVGRPSSAGPSYSFRQRLRNIESSDTPGPGSHDAPTQFA